MNKPNKRVFAILICVMMVMTIVVGCDSSSGPKFETGSWNDKVFENKWLGMAFQLPNEWKIATNEEIQAMVGASTDTFIGSDEKQKETLEKAMKAKTVYSFIIAAPTDLANIQLAFENLSLTIGGKDLTGVQYLDESKKLLESSSMDFEQVGEYGKKQIAGKEFDTMQLTLMGGLVTEDFYVFKHEDRMVLLVATYADEENKKSCDDFIAQIKEIK